MKNLEDVDICLHFAVRLAKLVFWILLVCSLPNTKADHHMRVIPAIYDKETTTAWPHPTTAPAAFGTTGPRPVPVMAGADDLPTDWEPATQPDYDYFMAAKENYPPDKENSDPNEGVPHHSWFKPAAEEHSEATGIELEPADATEPPFRVTPAQAKEINNAIEQWARGVEAEFPANPLAEELRKWDQLSVGYVPSPRTKRSLVQTSKMLDFKAYDCTVPADVTSVTMGPDLSCVLPDTIEHAENKTMTLLQRADHT